MATVRFSDELKRDIKSNAEDMFSNKLKKADVNVPISFDPNTIYGLLFKDHLTQMDAMPDGYFDMDNSFIISGIRNGGISDDMYQRGQIHMDMKRKRPWPRSMNAGVHGLANDRRSSYGTITLNASSSDAAAPGSIFVPFHFREAAANLLTIDELDPFGKIPEFKFCAVKVERMTDR